MIINLPDEIIIKILLAYVIHKFILDIPFVIFSIIFKSYIYINNV